MTEPAIMEDFATILERWKEHTSHNLRQIGKDENAMVDSTRNLIKLWIDNGIFSEFQRVWTLPPEIGTLTHLRELDITCQKITCLPKELCSLEKLRVLSIKCPKLERFPSDMSGLVALEKLIVRQHYGDIQNLLESLQKAPNLRDIRFRECNTLKKFSAQLYNFQALQTLKISNCPKFEEFPPQPLKKKKKKSMWKKLVGPGKAKGFSKELSDLRDLEISNCSFRMLSSDIARMRRLETLTLCNLQPLKELPPCIGALSSLQTLNLYGLHMKRLPDQLFDLENLRVLSIIGGSISKGFPPGIDRMKNLEVFVIKYCKLLTELPPGIGKLTKLSQVTIISDHNDLRNTPEFFALKTLQSLSCSCTSSNDRMLPPEIEQLESLEKLFLRGFHDLPTSLGKLSKLRCLEISGQVARAIRVPKELGSLSQLRVLVLRDMIIDDLIDENVLLGWPMLTKLLLNCHLNKEMSLKLFDMMHLLPDSLTELKFPEVAGVTQEYADEYFARTNFPASLEMLDICLINQASVDTVVALVQRMKHLKSFGHRSTCHSSSPLLQHYLDVNSCGRLLLEGTQCITPIPISVWPIVLARANTVGQCWNGGDSRRANIIYYLLHGPALAARGV